MHVRGEGGWPDDPVGGDAVGRGVEPAERHRRLSQHSTISLHLQTVHQLIITDPFCKAVVGS